MKNQEIEDYLNSLDDDKMDRLFNSIADLMDSVTDEDIEEARDLDKKERRNFFSRIISRNKNRVYSNSNKKAPLKKFFLV